MKLVNVYIATSFSNRWRSRRWHHLTSRPTKCYGIPVEYLRVPFTLLVIVPPRLLYILQICDIDLGRWPTVTLDPEIFFITATAWVSCGFPGSFLHSSSSPSVGSVHMDVYSWYPLFIDSIEKQQPSDIAQPACANTCTYTQIRRRSVYI